MANTLYFMQQMMNGWGGSTWGVGLLWLMIPLLIWSIAWKGVALWKSAKKNQIVWFVVFMLVNTAGILEILYIYWFSNIKPSKRKR